MMMHPSPVFGPVLSRRFGVSLGVDVIPRKLCTLDCIYCEVGRTDKRGFARKEYVPRMDVLTAIEAALTAHGPVDCVTYSGSGEPTLHSGLGFLLPETRRIASRPVVVLTNGTLLWRDDVRADLKQADTVCPSLNALSDDLFRRINRPHPYLRPDLILQGLITFRREFAGQYFLEILFVRGLNDSDEEVGRLRTAVDRIGPDKVHINTVVRPPAEPWARAVPVARLKEIREMLGPTAEIIPSEDIPRPDGTQEAAEDEIVALLLRRAMVAEEIAHCLAADPVRVKDELRRLQTAGVLRVLDHQGKVYYSTTEEPLAI